MQEFLFIGESIGLLFCLRLRFFVCAFSTFKIEVICVNLGFVSGVLTEPLMKLLQANVTYGALPTCHLFFVRASKANNLFVVAQVSQFSSVKCIEKHFFVMFIFLFHHWVRFFNYQHEATSWIFYKKLSSFHFIGVSIEIMKLMTRKKFPRYFHLSLSHEHEAVVMMGKNLDLIGIRFIK